MNAAADTGPLARRRGAAALIRLLQRLGLTVSRDDILWCYRHLLGREPESEAAILAHSRFFRFKSLVRCVTASSEYAGQRGAAKAPAEATAGAFTEADFRRCIAEHQQGRSIGAGEAAYVEMHLQRLLDTLNLVQRLLPQGGQLLDYSAMGFFTHAVDRLVGGVVQTNVSGVNYELDDYVDRYGAGRFDLCLNTEVLEHLLYDPSKMVCSINRLLKPGGHLVLSTPNAVAMGNALRLLGGNPPTLWNQLNAQSRHYFDRHNRDWTPFEVETLLREHGFEVLQTFTRDYYESTRTLLARSAGKTRWLAQNASHQHLGDTTFVVARKQRECTAPVRNSWLYVNLPPAGTP